MAPQASFAMNCFPALSKCYSLRLLDLSLVSDSPPLPDLFKTVAHLENLRTFRLPRSSGFGVHHVFPSFAWPPNLEDLSLSGGIDAHFLHGIVSFPQTLRNLTIEHCPLAKGYAVLHLLRTAVAKLERLEGLKVQFMPRLGAHALDDILTLLPHLKRLSVSVDYVTPALFDEGHIDHYKADAYIVPGAVARASHYLSEDSPILQGHQLPTRDVHLHTLELTNSGNPGVEDKITPIDVMIAIDEGSLPQLRVVRVARSLLWHSRSTKRDAEALADVLQEAERRDWESRVGVYEGLTVEAWERMGEGVKERAGVWMFEDSSRR